jgi:hypothetical protein
MVPGSRSRRWLSAKPLEQDRKLLALTPDECWPRSVNPVPTPVKSLPTMSSAPVGEPAAWLAQIIQFWLGPSPKAPRPSGKPWIVPNGPRPPPLNDDPWQD